MTRISQVHGREVLDSRGNPTVEVDIEAGGFIGRASVPAGASTGASEAFELRDRDSPRYDGRGVRGAVTNVGQLIAPAIAGMDPADQESIDRRLIELDGTERKTRLGANAMLGCSLAAAHAAAQIEGIPLWQHFHRLFDDRSTAAKPRMPLAMTNMISGGLHAGGNLDFQDVLVMPVGAADYPTALEWTVRIYRRLGELLANSGYEGRLVGDEGGYGPRLQDNRQAVEFVVQAIEAARLKPYQDVTIALDVAATHFFRDGHYRLAAENDRLLTASEMIDRLQWWADEFPISSIEDGLAEEDWDGWRALTARLGSRMQLVGDDLFTTNARRVQRGIVLQAANSVLIKVNQIGTLTETFETMRIARRAGFSIVVSARSGETEDTTIADLAVGVAADQIKIGSIVRSERLAKYNRLLRIVEELD